MAEAVSRQQCLTSVSILTRPSFSIMMPFSVLTEARYVGSTVPEFYERRALRKELATRRPSKTTFEYSCSIDFLRNIILKGGDVAMSQNAKWTLESYKRLKETIVSTFVTISRPPSATWPQIYLNDRDTIKEYERKQWASVAAIVLQLENKMFQSHLLSSV